MFVGSDSEHATIAHEYELIGVTVHTGTAEGGHYYSFIKDRNNLASENWYNYFKFCQIFFVESLIFKVYYFPFVKVLF